MREDTFSNSEHDAGRWERERVADDYRRLGTRWVRLEDVPDLLDVAMDEVRR